MIEVKSQKDCCGCTACGDACPQGAISFGTDTRGFLVPTIDQAKCVRCGTCRGVCPILNASQASHEKSSDTVCVAAVHKNFSVLFDSAAGGAFTALANVVYREGGFVGGAVWTEDFGVRQHLSDDKRELPRLRGVKYAQSDARGYFKSIQAAVESGRLVLASGAPCQLAALRLYFKNEISKNLYLVDFACTGAVSPTAWRDYLSEQEERVGSKIVQVKPMNKEYAWFCRTIKLVFKNKQVVYDTKDTSSFLPKMLRGDFAREACATCAFKGVPQVADITLAECVDNKFLDPSGRTRDIGCSLVIVHTEKGAELWRKASESVLSKELSWQEACADNPLLSGERGRTDSARVSRTRRVSRLVKRGFNLLFVRPVALCRLIRDNGILKVLRQQPVIAAGPSTYLDLKGNVTLKGKLILARAKAGLRHAGTSLFVHPEGELVVNGETELYRGADVEVLRGGKLIFEGGSRFNTGATISCATLIRVGRGVMAGPNVTIRDNSGGHWVNMPSYKNAKPVEIGEHAWLCEGCTIMPGVKIGPGAIVGARAVVFGNVPANTMVVGNPAEVVCEDVQWKY